MRLRLVTSIAVLLLTLSGCSSDGGDSDSEVLDDDSEIVSDTPSEVAAGPPEVEGPTEQSVPDSELIGTWPLRGYTLDDGTARTVPDTASAEIEFRTTALCE